jgi:hypothetical protein
MSVTRQNLEEMLQQLHEAGIAAGVQTALDPLGAQRRDDFRFRIDRS